jgi:hypothetical protein
LDINGSVLVTSRLLNMGFVLMITTAIASVFGILELFAMAMGMSEKTQKYFERKINRYVLGKTVSEKRNDIEMSFEYEKKKWNRGSATFSGKTFRKNSKLRKIYPEVSVTLENNSGIIKEQ